MNPRFLSNDTILDMGDKSENLKLLTVETVLYVALPWWKFGKFSLTTISQNLVQLKVLQAGIQMLLGKDNDSINYI